MALYAPTVSEAILDVLISSPCEWKYETMHAEIERKYIVPGCINGIKKNIFDSALKSLKKRRLIETSFRQGNCFVVPRKTFNISSYESQVKLLNDGKCNSSTNKILNKANHYVYYMQWENDPNHVKIGYSSKPAQRFVDFLTASPHRLFVLRIEEVDNPLAEIRIHENFENLRINREWFSYAGELKQYINSLSCETNIKIDQSISNYHKNNIFVHYF